MVAVVAVVAVVLQSIIHSERNSLRRKSTKNHFSSFSFKGLKAEIEIIFLVFFVANFIRFCPNFWVDFWEESIGFNVGFNFGDFQFIGYIHGLFENISTTDDEDVFVNFLPELNRFFNASYDEDSLFDLPVIRKALLQEDLYAENWRYICTLEQSRKHIPKSAFGSHRLNDLCAGLGIPLAHHHNALDDALACANLYEYLRSRYNLNERDIKIYR